MSEGDIQRAARRARIRPPVRRLGREASRRACFAVTTISSPGAARYLDGDRRIRLHALRPDSAAGPGVPGPLPGRVRRAPHRAAAPAARRDGRPADGAALGRHRPRAGGDAAAGRADLPRRARLLPELPRGRRQHGAEPGERRVPDRQQADATPSWTSASSTGCPSSSPATTPSATSGASPSAAT